MPLRAQGGAPRTTYTLDSLSHTSSTLARLVAKSACLSRGSWVYIPHGKLCRVLKARSLALNL
jgi:hypothetical protein